MTVTPPDAPGLEDLARHKVLFDNTWTLATVLATALVVLCWYFGLARVNIVPIIWTLAGLTLAQLGINSRASASTPAERQRALALASQLIGSLLIGVGWHLFGGLQQPLFPLLIVLPLLPAALVLNFWQQQVALLGLLGVLASGILLSPDTNSFIRERYGIRLGAGLALPDWIPRSATAFPDVSTSPAYDLTLIVTVAVVGVAVSTTARALVGICRSAGDRTAILEAEVAHLQRLSTELVARAPAAQVVVAATTGRIVTASERFTKMFEVADASGRFLLDSVEFVYPTVIRRLMVTGGEEIQGATVRGRDIVLRVRAEIMGPDSSRVAALSFESCDEIYWRSEVDALEEPVFAVNSRGCVVFLNRSALSLFGDEAEGVPATQLFDNTSRWWEIAPLESAKRALDRGPRRYLASIRRKRVADSLGELSIVHLQERVSAAAAAA